MMTRSMIFVCMVGGLLLAVDSVQSQEFADADVNKDGIIDYHDLLRLQQYWHMQAITINLPNLPAGARPLRLLRIPAGNFMMGRYAGERGSLPNEDPQHAVTIGYDFYLGETEVTQAQLLALMGSNPAAGGNDYPVSNVAWNDIRGASGFLEQLNGLGQGTFRLLSEAEWEYACRAGTSTRFSFGENLECDDSCGACSFAALYMWWCWNSTSFAVHPVAGKLANAFRFFDMHGNVWEWCEDDYHGSYTGAPNDGSAWRETPRYSARVVRGGDGDRSAKYCRSAYRNGYLAGYRNGNLGFRLAADLQ